MAESEVKTDETIVDDAVQFLQGTAPFIMENGMNPHVFSNNPYNPVPYGLLDLFYKLVHENRVGIIDANDSETGEAALVLCFVGDKGDGDVELYPVASLLKEEEITRYRAPTGDGGFYEPADSAE